MDRMDDQLSFLCYSNQMVNETMYFPYQNTARQMKEMEMQGIPVTIANLAIHRHREEEMNQERMRHNQIVQEATAERAREANKGKAREVVPDSEEESEELASSASEECSDRRTVAGYAKLTSPPIQGGNNQTSGIEGLSGEARVHSIRGGLQEVAVTKESIRGVSNRLAGPKLLKIFELHVAKTKFLNRFAILASRLELLDFKDFKNLHPKRVDSVRRGIDSKPFYTFLTELELQVESIREILESIRAFLNLENEESDMRSTGACRANDSAYGDSGPSGVVSVCGVLVPTWGKS
ncbi:hypothetical protein PIB30_063190 [Stylosanthes scabra]|uniref:Uncharacterized protein n=1 Tax=Stylosanthes scabra TaxID=79078 RepID=A0ABU6TLL8_9FABA|nr:hypothetical protein [Stylosanthes scabra]